MKTMKNFFVILYSIAPLIVIPYKEQNWYILFGIVFCYLGVALAAYKPSLFILAILFCIGFWIKSGFNIPPVGASMQNGFCV